MACIESIREAEGKTSIEARYYISSLDENPQKFVGDKEPLGDRELFALGFGYVVWRTRIRKENAPHAMAIVLHIALNLLQLAKTGH